MVITGSDSMPIAFGAVTGIGDRHPDSMIGLPETVIGMLRNPSEVAIFEREFDAG